MIKRIYYSKLDPKEIVFLRTARTEEDGKCWIWTGTKDAYGYGQISIGKKIKKAHRFSYVAFNGFLPTNLTIDHLCRNRICVNPKHLEAVSLAENKLRGNSPAAINLRKTHCAKGHPYSGDNLKVYYRVYGKRRYCITCQKLSDANRERKNRANGSRKAR